MSKNIGETIDFDSSLIEIYTKLSNDESLDQEEMEYILFKLLQAVIKANKDIYEFKFTIVYRHIQSEKERIMSLINNNFISTLQKEQNKEWIDVVPFKRYKKFYNEVIMKNKQKGDILYTYINPNNEDIRKDQVFEDDGITVCNILSISQLILDASGKVEEIHSNVDSVFYELFDLPKSPDMSGIIGNAYPNPPSSCTLLPFGGMPWGGV